jgi:hypothetical protein
MHKGTVMYIRRNMLPRLSFGSRLMNTLTGAVFYVVHSNKLSPYHQLVQLCLLYIFLPMPCIVIEQSIEWPCLCWSLLSLSGTDSKPELSYLDQTIPSPLNLRVSQSWSHEDILFRRATTLGPIEPLRRLSVNEYWALLKRLQLLQVFAHYRWRSMQNKRAKEVRQLVEHDLHVESRYDLDL